MATPLAVLFGFLALLSLSLTGWGTETDPSAQLARDIPWVLSSGIAGGVAGALLSWVAAGTRPRAMLVGSALGTLPTLVMVTAYFTDRY